MGERAEGIPVVRRGNGGTSSPSTLDLLLTTSLRWTLAGRSGIGSGTAGAAPLVHSTYLSSIFIKKKYFFSFFWILTR